MLDLRVGLDTYRWTASPVPLNKAVKPPNIPAPLVAVAPIHGAHVAAAKGIAPPLCLLLTRFFLCERCFVLCFVRGFLDLRVLFLIYNIR